MSSKLHTMEIFNILGRAIDRLLFFLGKAFWIVLVSQMFTFLIFLSLSLFTSKSAFSAYFDGYFVFFDQSLNYTYSRIIYILINFITYTFAAFYYGYYKYKPENINSNAKTENRRKGSFTIAILTSLINILFWSIINTFAPYESTILASINTLFYISLLLVGPAINFGYKKYKQHEYNLHLWTLLWYSYLIIFGVGVMKELVKLFTKYHMEYAHVFDIVLIGIVLTLVYMRLPRNTKDSSEYTQDDIVPILFFANRDGTFKY